MQAADSFHTEKDTLYMYTHTNTHCSNVHIKTYIIIDNKNYCINHVSNILF